jgi:hypothetical protein
MSDLQRKLDDLVVEMGLVGEGDTVVDYVLVVEGMHYDPDKDASVPSYGMAFQGGECRRTTAMGLTRVGLQILESGVLEA